MPGDAFARVFEITGLFSARIEFEIPRASFGSIAKNYSGCHCERSGEFRDNGITGFFIAFDSSKRRFFQELNP